jgi:hypothetical protein
MPEAPDPELVASWRCQLLDAQIAGRQVTAPAELRVACAAWLAEAAPAGLPPALGVAGAPEEWLDTLAWCGLPIGPGPLRWGTDLAQAAVDCPTVRDGRLLLPPPEALAGLTSLALKPLRLFIAERLGVRLQAAPFIRLWLWPGRAVLQSLAPMPLAGFLYGPAPGHRAGLALEAWGSQIETW